MIFIEGYQILSLLTQATRSVLYKGIRKTGNLPVIIKAPLIPHEKNPEEPPNVQSEFLLAQKIKHHNIIKYYAIEKSSQGPVLILEDFNAICLGKFIENSGFDIKTFLNVCIQIVSGLGALHDRNIIHNNLNPNNLLINPLNYLIKFFDFSNSSVYSKDAPVISSLNLFKSTLAYIPPEQTGRINRGIDQRSDLYSTGAIFYEMITGKKPFPVEDPLEMIHCHLAKMPSAPQNIQPSIPATVSDIIMKLLSKNPEDRYQSYRGLMYDLERCQWEIEKHDGIRSFPLGEKDYFQHVRFPAHLIGRENEISFIMEAFERIKVKKAEMILISGSAGIGKTALVKQVEHLVQKQNAMVISGKFDPLKTDIPYSALSEAFGMWVRHLLTLDQDEWVLWQKRLADSFEHNLHILVEIVPDLEKLVGKQFSSAKPGLLEEQNKFKILMQNFFRVLANSGRPLILFLDDLQWGDQQTLGLLEICMEDRQLKNILIIGAFRGNEVDETHPLQAILRKVSQNSSSIFTLNLSPLDFGTLVKFIGHCTNQNSITATPLAAFLFERTQGNPFGTIEFLKWLEFKNYLKPDPDTGVLLWDGSKMDPSEIPMTIIDLLTRRFKQLPVTVKKVISLASCIGNEFTFQLLQTVLDDPSIDLQKILTTCIHETFIIRDKAASSGAQSCCKNGEEAYRFLHDKIHSAAYESIGEKERIAIHSKIGQSLLKQPQNKEIHQKIFEIVNHLSISKSLMTSPQERASYAELSIEAGIKARTSGAFPSAFSYIRNAIDIMGESGWKINHSLMLSLYTEGVKAAYLCGKLETMEKWGTLVIERSHHLLEQTEIFEVFIQAKISEHRLLEAVELSITILKKFDITFPQKPTVFLTGFAFIKTWGLLRGKTPERLIKLPEMTHPEKIAISGILYHACSAAYFAHPDMLPLFILKLVQISVCYGNSIFSPLGYAGLGFMLISILGRLDMGFRYGCLAMNLAETGNNQAVKCTLSFLFNHFIRHWKESIHKIVPDFAESYQSGLDSGNFIYAAYCAQASSGYGLASSKELGKLKKDLAFYSNAINQIRQQTALHLIHIFYQTALNLSQEPDKPDELSGEFYDEHKMIPLHSAAKDKTATFCLYYEKLFLSYIFNDLESANKNLSLANEYIQGVLGTFYIPLFYFYESLILIGLYSRANFFQKIRTTIKVMRNQKKLKKWASGSPENHAHRVLLIEAEMARVCGKFTTAMEKYDLAIKIADQNGFIQEKGLSQELAFNFYLSESKETVAKTYLSEALKSYERWGAEAKIMDLFEKHKNLIPAFFQVSGRGFPDGKGEHGWKLSHPYQQAADPSHRPLDMATVIKASQAISSEVELDKFLKRMMNIIIENAGAQRGYFISVEDEKLKIEAYSDIENSFADLINPVAVDSGVRFPESIIRFVAKTGESVVLPSNEYNMLFERDPYFDQKIPASILCSPIRLKEKAIGVLYLENKITQNAFTRDRIGVLQILLSQAAISLENAKFFTKIKQMNAILNQEANERKLAQQALKESKERFKTIFDSVQAGIMIIDVEKHLIVDANPAALAIIGASKSELISRPCYQFLCSDYKNSGCPAKNFKISESNIESFIFTAAGDKIPVLKTLTSIRLDHRLHILESFIDIKKLKSAENERTKLLNQLQHSQKMEAIGTLAGGIAHDFNNILTSIIGFTELSLEDIEKGSMVYENLQEVSKATFRAKELVRQILTFARQSETEKKPVQISAIVKETVKFLRSSIPTIIEIHQELNSDEYVLADPTQIHQILMNLCTNAGHSMQPHGGTLSIMLNESHLDEKFVRRHSRHNPGRFLELTIQDTGCGMTNDVLERIFDPYFTTKEIGAGTGLGLSVVRGIVRSYNGIITVESSPAKGTTFHVYLPVLEKDIDQPSEVSDVIPCGNERILLVDDELAIINVGKRIIERLGYKVTTRTSSIEALQLFKHKPYAFDLVITDMTMPNMTGDKMALEMIRIRPDIPIILFTGYSELILNDVHEKIGIKAIKSKPFVKQDLAVTIRNVLGKG